MEYDPKRDRQWNETPKTKTTEEEVTGQLQAIASADDFVAGSYELTDAWKSAGVGIEAVEPVLRFMEENPTIDFGVPGPLVHFVEQFYGTGYWEMLIESIRRTPTSHTLWMLNRVINGTKAPRVKQRLIETMEQARLNPRADKIALDQATRFLSRLKEE
jgi:hypothetical protein